MVDHQETDTDFLGGVMRIQTLGSKNILHTKQTNTGTICFNQLIFLDQLMNRSGSNRTASCETTNALTLFSCSSLTLTDRSSRTLWYRSLWLWKSFCACSSLGRVTASRGPRFSSSRSTRYASYSILKERTVTATINGQHSSLFPHKP